MKPKSVPSVLLLLAACLLAGTQGWAKFGISKTRVTFMMHHPPAFHTPGRELRVEANALDPGNAPLANQLKGMLEQELIRGNFKPVPNAQTILQFTVNDASAAVEQQTRLESVNVHTGSHYVYDKKGNATEVEDCKWQEHQVTYLVSSGSLSVNLLISEAQSKAVVLSRVLDPRYQAESDIAGPTKCGGQGYGVSPGQLQSPPTIHRHLVERVVSETSRLVLGYEEPRTVLLAVDNELKPGNAQAAGGRWQEAFETWKNASLKANDKDKEAARQYNLGVAHEALAAAAMRNESLDEATSHLNDAEKCYTQALSLDPGEKYFRDTLRRLQVDRELLRKEQEHEFMKQAASMTTAAPQEVPSAPLTVNIPLEGWPEGETEVVHDYRVYVRTRVGAQRGEPSEALKQKLVGSAVDYGVKEGVALQVVDSEVKRFLVLRQNVEKYLDDFKDAASDGGISAEEREMLGKRQKILHLSDAQVKEVEARIQVREGE